MVCQRNGLQAWCAWHNGILGEIEGKMRGCGCAAAIAQNENATPIAIGFFEQSQNRLEVWERDAPDHLLKLCKVALNCIQCLVPLSLPSEKSSCYALLRLKCRLCVRSHPEVIETGHIQEHLCSLPVKTEVHAFQSTLFERRSHGILCSLVTVEHEEATTASPGDLSTCSS